MRFVSRRRGRIEREETADGAEEGRGNPGLVLFDALSAPRLIGVHRALRSRRDREDRNRWRASPQRRSSSDGRGQAETGSAHVACCGLTPWGAVRSYLPLCIPESTGKGVRSRFAIRRPLSPCVATDRSGRSVRDSRHDPSSASGASLQCPQKRDQLADFISGKIETEFVPFYGACLGSGWPFPAGGDVVVVEPSWIEPVFESCH